VTCVTAPILLADVGDYRFGVFSLDLKRSDERIFGVPAMWSVFPFSLSPTVNCTRHAFSTQYFGPDIRRWQGVLLGAIKPADEVSAWITARDAAWFRASASKLARRNGW
jgi:hypothetical protein